jgi:hypothetical protein
MCVTTLDIDRTTLNERGDCFRARGHQHTSDRLSAYTQKLSGRVLIKTPIID